MDKDEEVVETIETIEEVVVDNADEEVNNEPSEVEQKALKMGWTPKEDFKGDPSKWRSAEDFVERGENMLPIVKARVNAQAKEIEELRAAIKQFGEYHTKTEQRMYEKAMADLREQRAAAIAAADGAEFDRVDGQIQELRNEIADKAKIIDVTKKEAALDPVYVEWESRNQWMKDPVLAKEASKIGEALLAIGVEEKDGEFLDRVRDAIKLKYPEKFENPRRKSAPSVEGGVPTPRKGGKSYADLPADAKAACERMAKNAYADKPKDMAAFKAEYVKNYFEEA